MDTVQKAKKAIVDAEARLRELIEQGLEEQRYADVAAVAILADGLAKILAKGMTVTIQRAQSNSLKQSAKKPTKSNSTQGKSSTKNGSRKKSRTQGNRKDYPRFERDHDRLVKIGWSKKAKKEYEHRAPKEVVFSFMHHLVSKVGVGELFAVENLMPVYDASDGELPAYQVYLSLAWLRHAGVIEKKGRDGYVLRNQDTEDEEFAFDVLWDELYVRA